MSLSDLFGDEGERDRMYQQAFSQFQSMLQAGIGGYQRMMGDSFNYLNRQREQDIDQYTQMYQSTIGEYRDGLRQARENLVASFAEQRGLISEGFDASRQELQEGIARQRSQAQAAGAFTGLSNTSFGQAQVGAIERRPCTTLTPRDRQIS